MILPQDVGTACEIRTTLYVTSLAKETQCLFKNELEITDSNN